MLTCEICGQECKTVQGLIAHRRLKHLVVNGGRSGDDRSDQGSVSGGDRSGEWSGDHSEEEKAAAAAVAVVGAGVVAGDQSSEGSGEESDESWAERKILSIVREHQETRVWDPDFVELVKDVVGAEGAEPGGLSPHARYALRSFGKLKQEFESS